MTLGNSSYQTDDLSWLIAMGADELTQADALDRFVQSAQKQAVTMPKGAPTLPPEVKSISLPLAALTGLGSLTAITQALRFLDHPLRKTASQLSFYEGPEKAPILVVADKPRNEEDKSGLVFADKRRALLSAMLASIGLRLEDVGMMNLVPWRPPGNAPLKDQDVQPVLSYAKRAIQLVAPEFVLCFTAVPGFYLANGDVSFPRQRGKWLTASGTSFLPTFHPEELLRSSAQKKLAWRDLLIFKEGLDG